MRCFYLNVLKSVVCWIIITLFNLLIYLISFPFEGGIFQYFSYITYVGVVVNIIISMLGYMLCGRFMNNIENKYIRILSFSLPSFIGVIAIFIFLIAKYIGGFNGLAGWIAGFAIITNISCGFAINVMIGENIFAINILSLFISLFPMIFIFIGNRLHYKRR